MKPSQPNWFSHQPPRRVLSLQGPELHHSNRLGPPQHPAHPLGPIHSSEFFLGIPTNDGTPTNRPHHSPRDRLGPPQHSAQPLEPYCSSNLVPGCQSDIDTSVTRPKHSPSGISHYASPQFTKDLGNHNPSFQITRDHLTKPKVTLSYSGSKTATAKSQGSKKARSSDERSSIPTVQLHVPPVTSSLYTGAVQEVNTKPSSDSGLWSPGNSYWPPQGYRPSLSTQSAAPCQDQQTRSSEMLIPAVDLNCSSRKRHREIEECDDNAKKLSLQCANSCRVQILKPSVSTSPVPSTRHSSVLELLPKNTELHMEPAWRQSACLERSSKFKPVQSSCTSLSPNFCKKNQLPMGVKQAYIKSTKNHIVELKELESSSKPTEECLKKRNEENDKRNISSTLLSPEVPQRDTSSLPHDQLGSHHSGLRHCGTSVLPAKTLSRGNQLEESRIDSSTPKSASNPNSGSLSCHKVELNKTARPRRRKIKQDDIDVLFTPDPMTYVVSPVHKTAKPKIDGGTIKSPTSEKSCSTSTVISSRTPVTGSSSHKIQVSTVGFSPHVCTRVSSSTHNPQSLMPAVTLKRVRLENILPLCSKDRELKNSPITSSGRQLKDESVKSGEKCTSLFPNNVTSETDTAASEQTPTSKCSRSPLSERRASEVGRKQVTEEDSIDVELDLDLSFALDLDLTQSSHSSEEEQLLSLQEMMERVTKPPDTPEKGAFSEPSTPGHHSSQLKTQSLPSTTKPGLYKNNLDQMLKEINTNKKAKETERQLITACKEGLLRIAEYEEAEEKQEEGISAEQQEFLQRYSLMSNAIREVPPGEVVFNLEKFGRIFNQDTLELRQCMVTPVGTAQKTLLWSSPAQLRLHVNIGLLQEAYNCHSPCPSRVTRFLFKMMSVHSERMVSEKILQGLCDIARTAAYQIVKNGSKQFKVWVPSLADLTLVLMNMGVAFVTLFPFENLQPPFTEGDLLEDIYIKSDSPSSKEEHGTFPEHNFNNLLKYLSYCVGLCPRAYSDDELLLLLTMIGRVGLDTWLILESNVELSSLQYKVVNNIKDWDTMLPRICSALTDLTTDHHNMCLLVQLLPDNTRGKQLRRHLSMSMISKLIDGHCTYRPTEKEFQLSKLRPYLPCMQPSTLLRGMLNSSTRSQKDKENTATLDQQSYYLCYSLLTLANEASNFQFFPAHQKEQLLILCSELETHVKCDIRESEKCLYRSKVKDLVARIYTKWQILLQRTRPLNGKLYDYWQPRPVDTLISGQEEHNGKYSGNGEVSAMEEDEQEEETNETEGNKAVMIAEDKGGAEKQGMKPDEKIGEMRAEDPIDDESKTEEAKEAVPGDLAQELPEEEEKEPEVHKESQVMEEHIDAGKTECTEVETENLVETRQTSSHNQAAACDLMS